MPEFAVDPLYIALFVMVVLPMLAVLQFLTPEKKLSDRLLKDDKKQRAREIARSKPSDKAARLDVRKEMPTSRFGALGRLLDYQISRNLKLSIKIVQSGLKYSFADLVILDLLFFSFFLFSTIFLAGLSIVVVIIMGSVLFGLLPFLMLNMAIGKRQKSFLSDFPDALDLVVRGIRSGLPVTEAIATISQEFKGPIGEIFGGIQSKVAIGQSLEQALWVTSVQMPIPEFRFFVVALAIQQETGGNLGEILSKLSSMIRKRQQLKLKIKAMSSEARASAMIIGSLPFLMMGILYMINPDYIATLFLDPRGNMMLAGGGMMLTLGVATMAKLSKFEI